VSTPNKYSRHRRAFYRRRLAHHLLNVAAHATRALCIIAVCLLTCALALTGIPVAFHTGYAFIVRVCMHVTQAIASWLNRTVWVTSGSSVGESWAGNLLSVPDSTDVSPDQFLEQWDGLSLRDVGSIDEEEDEEDALPPPQSTLRDSGIATLDVPDWLLPDATVELPVVSTWAVAPDEREFDYTGCMQYLVAYAERKIP
jgi:hypothetical protein